MDHQKFKQTMIRSVATSAMMATLLLGGCADFHQASHSYATNQNRINNGMTSLSATKASKTVTFYHQPFLLGAQVVISRTNNNLPANPLVTVNLGRPVSLRTVGAVISQQTGFPVAVSSQITTYLSTQDESQSGQLPGLSGNVLLPGIGGASHGRISVTWKNKSLRGLLNYIASNTGTYWEFINGQIRFYLTKTQAFEVDALPGTADMTANITNAGTSSGTGGAGGSSAGSLSGSTDQTASYSTSLDIYSSIEAGVKAILARSQGTSAIPTSVAINQSTGQVIVTATPPELRAVGEYLRPINKQMSKNVVITMHIYSVQLNRDNNLGLNLTSVFRNIGANYGLNLTGVAPPSITTGTPGTVSAAILGDGNGNLQGGSQALVQALAQNGKTSLVTSGSVLALNGQPTPLQVAQTHTYAASTSVTNSINVGSTAAIVPGSYTVGFSGTFLPLVRGNHILLEYTVNLQQDLGLVNFSSDGTTVQQPNTAIEAFMQRVARKKSEKQVLAGFLESQTTMKPTGDG
jgi:type IVB pilus formation R64 PilN family outer membrane protein